MFKSKKLSNYNKTIMHAFFNSQGGVSTGIYKGLNCGPGSKDKKINIKENLNIVKKKIKCKQKNLILLNQIHSNKTFKILKITNNKMDGDGFITKKNDIAFVIANGENSASEGVGITKSISEKLFSSGVDVITTGNHIWDQKETANYINTESRLLRPLNLFKPSPGNGFEVYKSKNGFKVGVLNLMGNVFMKKCDDVFNVAKEFLLKKKLKA